MIPLPLGEGWGEGLSIAPPLAMPLFPSPSPRGRREISNSRFLFVPRRSLSLHRIVAAGMKRVTTQDATQSHRTAPQRAIALNRFQRIFGTRWNKATGRRQPGRDRDFVELQKRNKNGAHLIRVSSPSVSASSVLSPPSRSGYCPNLRRDARPAQPEQ